MLKTVSSITNAIGALNYKGTWDANANSPALTSSVGTKGDYYVVGTAGSTNLNGISNWGIGDWAAFNGSVWQRVEGGANLNGVDLSVSGTSTLSGLTASTALALNASKEVISIINTGTGNNVLATTPTLVGDVNLSTGNLVMGTAGKGIDFSINPAAPGVTSELLDDYEIGTWTPSIKFGGAAVGITYSRQSGTYTKVGNVVTVVFDMRLTSKGSSTGGLTIEGLPFASVGGVTAGFAIAQLYLYSGYVGLTKMGTAYTNGSTVLNEPIDSLSVAITDTNFTNSAILFASFTYRAA